MEPMTIGLLAGAALGALKGEQDKGTEREDRLLNSEITRYSPWTRINPMPVRYADQTGSIMQGAMSGAMMGQGIGQTNAANQMLQQQQIGQMAQGGMSPYAAMQNPYLMNNQYSQPGTMLG